VTQQKKHDEDQTAEASAAPGATPEAAPEATPMTAEPPPQYTSTGAPVDNRFSHPPEDGRPQHLKNAITEQAPQPLTKKNEAAPAEEEDDDEDEGRKGSKKRR